MNIEIICIGKLKEDYLKAAENEYLKRLSPYCKITTIEVREARTSPNDGLAIKENIRQKEGEALLSAVKKTEKKYVIALDMRGSQMTSERFAESIGKIMLEGKSTIAFLIGGSLGLSEIVRQAADRVISFSEMTFPHQLMRIILLEQIYRAQKILKE